MSIHLRNEKASSRLKILLKTCLCYLHKFNFDPRVNCIVLFMETNHGDWNFIVLSYIAV